MIIHIPTNCPCCDYPLELVNAQLFCRNLACGAQLSKKIEHFCKTLSIKGLGPKTVEKLNLGDITEIFWLEESDLVSALGSDKLAEKLIIEISKATKADLATVLTSFAIPLVGNTATTKICSIVTHIDEINAETCKEAGLGAKVTENLLTWLSTDFLEIKEFLPFDFKSRKVEISNTDSLTVCITGKLVSYKTKSEATKVLVAAGFKVVETVTRALNYLVDEDNKASTKRKKAEEYGITIITNLNDLLTQKET
jgi:NAD-dependent DNA ligase